MTKHGRLTLAGALTIATAGLAPSTAAAQQTFDVSSAALPLATKAPPLANALPTPSAKAPEAAAPASSFDAKFGAALTSDYNYRGYTLSDHKPSASANIEATYNIFFAGANFASVDMPSLSHIQMTDSAGVRPVFGPLTVETGIAYYSYPGSGIDLSYPEFYAAPSYAVTSKLTIGVSVYYAPDYNRTGAWENYDSVVAKYAIGSGLTFSAEFGRQSFGTTHATETSPSVNLPDYFYWNAGLSYTYKELTFDLRYFATNLSHQSCYLITGTGSAVAGSNGCDPAVVATLTWNTNLLGRK